MQYYLSIRWHNFAILSVVLLCGISACSNKPTIIADKSIITNNHRILPKLDQIPEAPAKVNNGCETQIEQLVNRVQLSLKKLLNDVDNTSVEFYSNDFKRLFIHIDKLLANCPSSYSLQILKGDAHRAYRSFYYAGLAYQAAEQYATTTQQAAQAVALQAQVYLDQGDFIFAQTLVHQARLLLRTEGLAIPDELNKMALDLGKKAEVTDLLMVNSTQPTRKICYISDNICKKSEPPDAFWFRSGIKFSINSAKIPAGQQTKLQQLAHVLNNDDYKHFIIRIVGHTCKLGDTKHNDNLSMDRAHSLYNALLTLNPDIKNRIIIEGRGDKEPLYFEDNETSYALNRRVTVELFQPTGTIFIPNMTANPVNN